MSLLSRLFSPPEFRLDTPEGCRARLRALAPPSDPDDPSIRRAYHDAQRRWSLEEWLAHDAKWAELFGAWHERFRSTLDLLAFHQAYRDASGLTSAKPKSGPMGPGPAARMRRQLVTRTAMTEAVLNVAQHSQAPSQALLDLGDSTSDLFITDLIVATLRDNQAQRAGHLGLLRGAQLVGAAALLADTFEQTGPHRAWTSFWQHLHPHYRARITLGLLGPDVPAERALRRTLWDTASEAGLSEDAQQAMVRRLMMAPRVAGQATEEMAIFLPYFARMDVSLLRTALTEEWPKMVASPFDGDGFLKTLEQNLLAIQPVISPLTWEALVLPGVDDLAQAFPELHSIQRAYHRHLDLAQRQAPSSSRRRRS